jgi:hypothetical protein
MFPKLVHFIPRMWCVLGVPLKRFRRAGIEIEIGIYHFFSGVRQLVGPGSGILTVFQPARLWHTIWGMAKPKNRDFNQNTVRALSEATAKHEQPLPTDIEAAWEEWSRGIGKVDERGMALLRAAFEAGMDVGKRLPR